MLYWYLNANSTEPKEKKKNEKGERKWGDTPETESPMNQRQWSNSRGYPSQVKYIEGCV